MAKRAQEASDDYESYAKRRRTSPTHAFARLSLDESPEPQTFGLAAGTSLSPWMQRTSLSTADMSVTEAQNLDDAPDIQMELQDASAACSSSSTDVEDDTTSGVHRIVSPTFRIIDSAQEWMNRQHYVPLIPNIVGLTPSTEPPASTEKGLILYTAFQPWATPRTAEAEAQERATRWREYLTERERQEDGSVEGSDEREQAQDEQLMDLDLG